MHCSVPLIHLPMEASGVPSNHYICMFDPFFPYHKPGNREKVSLATTVFFIVFLFVILSMDSNSHFISLLGSEDTFPSSFSSSCSVPGSGFQISKSVSLLFTIPPFFPIRFKTENSHGIHSSLLWNHCQTERAGKGRTAYRSENRK